MVDAAALCGQVRGVHATCESHSQLAALALQASGGRGDASVTSSGPGTDARTEIGVDSGVADPHTRPLLTFLAAVARVEGEPSVPSLSLLRMISPDDPESARFRRFLLDRPPAASLAGRDVFVLATHGVEEIELHVPTDWLRAAGATVRLVAPRPRPIAPSRGAVLPVLAATHVLTASFMDNRGWVPVDLPLDVASELTPDAVFIPGGAWNPDLLRGDPAVLTALRAWHARDVVLAALCHGPLVLVSAGLVRGRRATAFGPVQIDLANAGAQVADVPAVTDGLLVTGRAPRDLPDFLEALAGALAGSSPRRSTP